MYKGVCSAVFGAATILAVIGGPASAADDIESRVQVCASCHGQSGVPINAQTPTIWGQQGNYLYKELHDFKSGDRPSPIMQPMVQGFTLPELRDVANYFAAKTWPAKQVTVAAASPAAAASAPSAPPDGSAMCRPCHGQNFEGGAPAPRLAGLSYEYLIGAMDSFANGQRANNLDMPGFMKALSESQRQAIAHYLAGL